ncbi:MAG: protein kinase, partial [Candidatus Aminicenantes bacterium]|nr:protein kinase [Candidatus Aminicenantes bacterium]
RQMTADPEAKQRFEREAQAAAALNHPNIVTVYEIGEHEDQVFIAMEYIEGQTLKELITVHRTPFTVHPSPIAPRPLPLAQVIDIATQIASGLAVAHAKGIVHRDIKPQNILIDKDDRVKILDFGLAKLKGVSSLTIESSTLGTVHYMSPEQAMGKDIDQRSDIWSLGVVLYEMLSGQLPFRGEYDQAVIYSILNEEPEKVSALVRGIPDEYDRILEKTLAKDLAERYQHADDLLVDLKRIKRDSQPDIKTGKAGPPRKIQRLPKWALPTILTVLLGIAAGLYLALNEKAKHSAHAALADQSTWTHSIAVLPFADLSKASDQDYFCEGMAEDIRTKLTRLSPRLKVIARYAMLPYKNNRKPLSEIARELDVETILEGSVQKEGDRIRVNAQLINARDGAHIWADLYDRKVASVFDVQDEISLTIVKALEIKLTPEAKASLVAGRPRSFEAYEYVLKGQYIINNTYIITRLDKDFEQALEMFQKAFALEPNYALAYAGLAWAYEIKYSLTGKPELHELVLAYAKKSYDIAPDLAQTNACVGYYFFSRNDLDRSFASYRRALALDPNLMEILQVIAVSYSHLGLYLKAIKFYRRILELSPGFLFAQGNLASCYLHTGDQENAADLMRKVMTVTPDIPVYVLDEAEILLRRGRPTEAKIILEKAASLDLNITTPQFSYLRAVLAALNGDRRLALMESQSPDIYALLGMKDESIQALKDFYGKHSVSNNFSYLDLLHNPFLDPLRNDPRFKEIVKEQKAIYDERLRKYGDL